MNKPITLEEMKAYVDATWKKCQAEAWGEPVAWMDREGDLYKMPEIKGWAPPHTMLYTAAPKREWVGLTDEEYTELWGMKPDLLNFFRKIEAKLKEKNT